MPPALKTIRRSGLCSIALALCASGQLSCIPAELVAQIAEQEAKIQNLQKSVSELEGEMQDGLSLALCSTELRDLLESVRKECGEAGEGGGPAMCTTQQVRGSVMHADPEHKGRFLKFMSHLPHEVVYLAAGATEIPPHRLEKLERLARRAVLKNTVFLIVSSPESGVREAEARAEVLLQKLTSLNIPREKLWRWIYAFPANRAEIEKKSDLPGLGEDPRLNHGVWIFRADC